MSELAHKGNCMSCEIEQKAPSTIQKTEAKAIKIGGRYGVNSMAFLADGKHFLTSEREKNIRSWRVEDMEEEGTPMNTGGQVYSIAVSRDGRWIVGGDYEGNVTVFDAQSREQVAVLKLGHPGRAAMLVSAVDVSPDGTTIVSGSADKTARVWSLATDKELFRLKHDNWVIATKFSRDAELFATATSNRESIRIYHTQQGRLITDFKIFTSGLSLSIAWSHKSNHLFAASLDGYIYHLDASAMATLSKWRIDCLLHCRTPQCIVLARNETYIAVSSRSHVSFWDLMTHEKIGSPVEDTHFVTSMAVSPNHDMVTHGDNQTTLRNLCEILPSRYTDISPVRSKLKDDLAELQARYEAQSHELKNSHAKIASLENTVQELRLSRENADTLQSCKRMHQCGILCAQDCVNDAALSPLDILGSTRNGVKVNKLVASWLPELAHKCITLLEDKGDEATRTNNDGEALAAYTAALSFSPSIPNNLLSKWVGVVLRHGSVDEAMVDATSFKLPTFDLYQAICDALEGNGRVVEAVECLRQMQQKLSRDVSHHNEQVEQRWKLEFQKRCIDRLQKLGDAAMGSHKYHEAAEHFSTILSLDPADRIEILIKRSKAQLSTGSWEGALRDADEAVELDPSSHNGHEQRHAALLAGKRHPEAIDAHRAMLVRLKESPHARIRELRNQYIDVIPVIQQVIDQTISNMPRVLIDTATGRLYDKAQRAAAFKKLPIYDTLHSSMTTLASLDHSRIMREVQRYYRYVMLSHRWEKHGEPSYQGVQSISVYELESSSPNAKLRTFCKLARSLGFHWAWSDTCCIDQKDIVVLHESLVAMFMWYRGSALTVIHLCGVQSQFQKRGDLQGCEWNERGWTYQEYLAAETVQFYTEDWRPYLGLDMFNHKESPIIVAEMEEASRVSVRELAALQPGLDRVREKLFLASRRQTTLPEDAAYSLLGIFNANIFIRYGEGKCTAIGRLLEHILTGSCDVTILAWTGPAGGYNSCLPPDLTVYNQLVPLHIPHPIEPTEMDVAINALRSSLPDSVLSSVAQFYHRLNQLPLPSLNAGRLRLPGLAFPVTQLQVVELETENSLRVYRGTTTALGEVEIKTTDNPTRMMRLLLFYPWACMILDQDFSSSSRDGGLWLDDTTRALRLLVRLRQPFGALLLTQVGRVQYRRIATDSLIMAQVRQDTMPTELMKYITMVDVQ